MEYSEYGRSPLDNYTTGELQAEIDRRRADEGERKLIEKAAADITENIDNASLIKKTEYLHANFYEIMVRKLSSL